MRCERCFRRCSLSDGQTGICQAVSYDGKQLLLEAPSLSTVSIGPIEEKAIFHYRPGSPVLSVGFYNCNLRCSFCINHQISQQSSKKPSNWSVLRLFSAALVDVALKEKAEGLAFSFSEPLVYAEFVGQTFRLAHDKGLYTVLKTSAMMSNELFFDVLNDTDVCCIDVKGDASTYQSSCDVSEKDLELLYYNLEVARESTNLEVSLIVRNNEKRFHSVLTEITGVIGPLTPVHLVSFLPAFKEASSPAATLENMQMAHGLASIYFEYVYDESPASSTTCRKCYLPLVKRNHGAIEYNGLKGNACVCGQPLWKNTCATITNAKNAGPSSK